MNSPAASGGDRSSDPGGRTLRRTAGVCRHRRRRGTEKLCRTRLYRRAPEAARHRHPVKILQLRPLPRQSLAQKNTGTDVEQNTPWTASMDGYAIMNTSSMITTHYSKAALRVFWMEPDAKQKGQGHFARNKTVISNPLSKLLDENASTTLFFPLMNSCDTLFGNFCSTTIMSVPIPGLAES